MTIMNTDPREIWVLDDDPSLRWVMGRVLEEAGHLVRGFNSMEDIIEALNGSTPAVLITDIYLPPDDGLKLLRRLRDSHPHLPVVVVTARSDLQSAVSAYQGGAFEYLPKPFDVDELALVVTRALQGNATPGIRPRPAIEDPDQLIGAGPAMQSVFRAIGRLAGTNFTVLITGESGTGKELVARALHRHSPRSHQPFIALNTAAIPAELLESELFGHERGAFTGANALRVGRFEQAHGGTLFLDEIGDMPPPLQTRLLRVLAEGEFYRVGGRQSVRVDVRVISATHQQLEKHVQLGHFREDLFHRLNVVQIHIPPLRERREDFQLLLEHLMASAAQELELPSKRLTADAMAVLRERDWPGNVRELRNVCRRLMLMAPGRIVHRSDLAELLDQPAEGSDLSADWREYLRTWARRQLADGRAGIFNTASDAMQRVLIEVALESSAGHRQDAARFLGIGRNTLTRKLKG